MLPYCNGDRLITLQQQSKINSPLYKLPPSWCFYRAIEILTKVLLLSGVYFVITIAIPTSIFHGHQIPVCSVFQCGHKYQHISRNLPGLQCHTGIAESSSLPSTWIAKPYHVNKLTFVSLQWFMFHGNIFQTRCFFFPTPPSSPLSLHPFFSLTSSILLSIFMSHMTFVFNF